MLWSGRPEIKQIERVLDDANLLKVFPTDDELEGRRRLCAAAFEFGERRCKPVNAYMAMGRYAKNNRCNFADDFRRLFACGNAYDVGDAKGIFDLLSSRNIIELGIGYPRKGRCDLIPYFDWPDVDMIHRRIKDVRDERNAVSRF